MSNKKIIFAAAFFLINYQFALAQILPPPLATPQTAETLAKNIEQIAEKTPVSRERREQAYAKLLEGQRYIWNANPRNVNPKMRSAAAMTNAAQLARQALQKAVELDPMLAEGYTALAELAKNAPPYNIEESILLADIAVKVDKNNFGGHYILAQLYTFKSLLNRGILDANFAQKAIIEWNEIARLDSRNAEAYAFLSELYARTKKPEEQINALRNWVAASAPVSDGFYGRIFKGEDLAPENASLKLGAALIKAKQTGEAIEILSRLIADEPENQEAVELLTQAVVSVDESSATIAAEALQQAVNTNTENTSLIVLLAQLKSQTGKIDEAAKLLRDASAKIAEKDKSSAANLQVALGDLYVEKNRLDDAVETFQTALTTRGIGGATEAITDDERDFAIRVYNKIIETYKKANRLDEAKAAIERARIVLGNADLFADKKLISLYLETGKKQEALQAVRSLRARNADDYSLLRLEATLLTEDGKVDEAIALVKSLIGKVKPPAKTNPNGGQENGDKILTVGSPMYDDFSNYLFISTLYSQAKRGREAVEAVNQALTAAQSEDRKQIARLTLASVQQTTGDFQSAEATLRGILKESPQNPVALNNLGYFLTERGERLDEALQLIKQAVEIDSGNPSYLDSLGWVYFKLGKLDDAEKYLKNALRIDDSSTTIQEHLGDVYQKQGKDELAKTVWQKALSLASDAEDISRLKTKLDAKNPK